MRKSKAVNCNFFRKRGNVFGGCTHPKATSACLSFYLQDCDKSKKRLAQERLEI